MRTLMKGSEQRSPNPAQYDRQQTCRKVGIRRDEQHAIRTQQEGGQMQAQPDNRWQVLALLKGAQEAAVNE